MESAQPAGELTALTAAEAARLIAAGALSSRELVVACLARIEARDRLLQAWVHVDPELALAAAAACDNSPARRPLRPRDRGTAGLHPDIYLGTATFRGG